MLPAATNKEVWHGGLAAGCFCIRGHLAWSSVQKRRPDASKSAVPGHANDDHSSCAAASADCVILQLEMTPLAHVLSWPKSLRPLNPPKAKISLSIRCPLYPQKRTCAVQLGMSAARNVSGDRR
jgi:hypothetical protein